MILDYYKFQAIKGCTLNNKQLVEKCIEESEFHDFRKLCGDTVYNGIIEEQNSDEGYSEKLQAILDKGVYKCLAYFAYANYLLQGGVVDTFSGPVQKNNPYSDHISSGTQKNLYVYNRDIACEYYELARKEIEEYFGVGKCGNDGGERRDMCSELIGVRRCNGKGKVEIIDM